VTFGPNTPRSRQLIKDFRERNGSMDLSDYLTFEEVYFTPNDFSPYYY
jgi:hypothetical protein